MLPLKKVFPPTLCTVPVPTGIPHDFYLAEITLEMVSFVCLPTDCPGSSS